ncbi:MAG: hypothetical protein ACHQ51_08105 [Elusimicrobiota bacterium]
MIDARVGLAATLAAACAFSACAGVKPARGPAPAVVSAAPRSAPAPAAAAASVPMPAVPLVRVGGIVVASDPAARSVTIRDYQGRTRAFRLADGARLTRGGDESAVSLDAVSAGDKIRLKVGGDVAAEAHVLVAPAR